MFGRPLDRKWPLESKRRTELPLALAFADAQWLSFASVSGNSMGPHPRSFYSGSKPSGLRFPAGVPGLGKRWTGLRALSRTLVTKAPISGS
jgi:hypothetical protein